MQPRSIRGCQWGSLNLIIISDIQLVAASNLQKRSYTGVERLCNDSPTYMCLGKLYCTHND